MTYIYRNLGFAFVLGAGLTQGVSAQEGRFELRSDNALTRSDPFLADDSEVFDARAFDLETAFDSNTWMRWVQPGSNNDVWRFEQQVRLRAYTDRDELNSALFTPRIQYWKRSDGGLWQVRASAAYSYMVRDGGMHWARPEGELQLRWRPSSQDETVFSGRVTHYNFNDGRLPGFDQTRVRFGLEQIKRFETPSQDQIQIAIYHEKGDADLLRQDYEEWRVRGRYQRALSDRTTLKAEVDYRDREYEGQFSNLYDRSRSDERWRVDVEVDHQVREGLNVYAQGGYVDNRSNIPTRDYDGAVFRFGVRIAL